MNSIGNTIKGMVASHTLAIGEGNMEHTNDLTAMRLALYELNDQIGHIAKAGEVEESILKEYNDTHSKILDDASELGDRAWVTDRLTQAVYDIQTLQRLVGS